MKIIETIFFSFFTLNLFAQTGYNVGDKVKNFTANNVTHQNKISLAEYSEDKGIVIVFTSQDCPYSKLYEERIIRLANEFEINKVRFILINPNNPAACPSDGVNEMTARAKEMAYNFPYLPDKNFEISNAFGVTKTPEVFVLKNINKAFVLFYKGAIDDNPQAPRDVHYHYLRDALLALVQDNALKVSEKRAIGCIVKR